ncbi:pyrimidine-nucleoside phosphorylase [Clostridium chauvoei]|uniref:Pyrimidine-nucleoside phosphorylase n=2 Tax=Clostridium chauvoei TaxID=46867 RepID=S6EKS8_9CLOT|nr:pyrimidine-nucleoside phosphorylase [Clostridium chauvoei]ATD55169.1 pyrimidine-nucleoside phosphorylase [Clostridium chauvoei]ATD57159.1 pyrimidine-nucleoside phosphorylase [Clostridium chauvoei]MBX7279510.1 pyrimidine-nucleoside phosphorylase [Clostridium chauvoei]MBX7281879.1 pyrimidine-nucleoside phosphorylase [Clostridium chauvoei]MBX7284532.1 pyrimidine-nucleoside phosphorylase [Clostridium chauvoei]
MRMYDVILKKRIGEELSKEEIEFFVNGYTKGEIPDYQASALLMAIFFNKMNKRETADLTMAMVRSGDEIDLSSIKGVKVDKHSTGGVGDKTSICLTPLVASLGAPVSKMSGRGLGHTGGTIDKLESFPGFTVELTEEQFIKNSNDIGIAIMGQTGNITPADKKIYALRDVTATVDNRSLIAASIMSKKIASGSNAIVLDVKVGEGAFMKTPEDAKALAQAMVDIGTHCGRQTIGVISDMDQPLGYAIGNALEVKEAIELLKGNGPKDLLELVLTLGSNMLVCGKIAKDFEEGKKLLMQNIENGKGLAKLKEFVAAQGGDASYVDDVEKLPKAKHVVEVKCEEDGFVSKIHAEEFGLIAMELGAGRATKESEIDLAVGIVLNKKRGDKVSKGDVLAYIHSNDENNIAKTSKKIKENFVITEKFENNIPLIYDIVK